MAYMIDKDGYLRTRLTLDNGKRRNFPVHRLVLTMFSPIKNMTELQVNHRDGDKHNNSLSNLEWCTTQENIAHAVKMGLRDDKGENNYFHKLSNNDVYQIKELYKTKQYTQSDIAKMYNINAETVGKIIRGHSWKHLL